MDAVDKAKNAYVGQLQVEAMTDPFEILTEFNV
jgi:hypothetical protein